ncbi:hypothetical protein PGT21_029465 [Puccinia graminis f. sp. tritici]|uniref:Uncharacterized protein n=1 Tax=Puccinia graminis f. sp. tritici TaxID=56615 RepID=A0A5B0NRZ3_PUCGR|nr:hypothetical protein PGT21_029465 [Puccinia graminis f. sp. tritici]
MSTTRDSTPCPSPRYNRHQKGKAPANRADMNLVASPGQSDVEKAGTSKEIIQILEQRLNESQELLEKLKKIHNPRQPAQTQLKVVSGSVLQTQPKIWTSAAYKRHSQRAEKRGTLSSIGSFTTPSTPSVKPSFHPPINSSINGDGTDQSVTDDQFDVMSTTATIATVQPTPEDEEARRLRDSLMMPRLPRLDATINSWRKKVAL